MFRGSPGPVAGHFLVEQFHLGAQAGHRTGQVGARPEVAVGGPGDLLLGADQLSGEYNVGVSLGLMPLEGGIGQMAMTSLVACATWGAVLPSIVLLTQGQPIWLLLEFRVIKLHGFAH